MAINRNGDEEEGRKGGDTEPIGESLGLGYDPMSALMLESGGAARDRAVPRGTEGYRGVPKRAISCSK